MSGRTFVLWKPKDITYDALNLVRPVIESEARSLSVSEVDEPKLATAMIALTQRQAGTKYTKLNDRTIPNHPNVLALTIILDSETAGYRGFEALRRSGGGSLVEIGTDTNLVSLIRNFLRDTFGDPPNSLEEVSGKTEILISSLQFLLDHRDLLLRRVEELTGDLDVAYAKISQLEDIISLLRAETHGVKSWTTPSMIVALMTLVVGLVPIFVNDSESGPDKINIEINKSITLSTQIGEACNRP